MYVFIGLGVSEFFLDLRKEVLNIYDKLGFDNNLESLPFHISLKMSFHIPFELLDDVLDTVTNYIKNCNPVMVFPKGIELENGICWIRMQENKVLNRIHDEICTLLQEKFSIPLHEYDLDYIFHTTLFLHNDVNKVNEAYELIRNWNIPKEIIPEEVLIGVSDDGSVGSYEIIRRIYL